ncbi:PP2C family protein-serine/threonine phosphatase [Streptomyces sp. NPDC048338]|uniref:PP2C family protein-serine/threonine phosphatase n=1 Tax=Streptomyces sp. NPDC048338 TaxID=3365536 RepID=UPI00371B7BEE
MPLTLRFAVRSDKGLVRESNEDSVFAASHLLVVADGMGGHAGGEVASAALVARMANIAPIGLGDDPSHAVLSGIAAGNEDIARRIAERPELEGMGTTVTSVLLTPDARFAVTNVGDSRTYLLRGGELSPLTRDDSLIQTLMDKGRISEAEAAVHPHRSVVTCAVVGSTQLAPAVTLLPAAPGDRLLLCSDGLTDLVPYEEIARLLREPERESVAGGLVELALRAGGSDNVTVIVADVVDEHMTDAEGFPTSAGQETQDASRRGRRSLLLGGALVLVAGVCCLLLLWG